MIRVDLKNCDTVFIRLLTGALLILLWAVGDVPGKEAEISKAAEVRLKNPPSGPIPEQGPLRITIQEAIFISLENNRSLRVQRLDPAIRQTFEDEERALFDPVIDAEAAAERTDAERQSGTGMQNVVTDIYEGEIALSQFFPTGTTLEVAADARQTESSSFSDPFTTARLGLSLTQSLMRGYGRDVNLVELRQARLETDISQYELRGFSENLLAEVETAYWDYALALRQIEIVQESLKVVKQQLEETREMIRVGKMAEAELVAVQAEVAVQEQGLIDAKSDVETARLELVRLLNPQGTSLWDRDVVLIHQPTLPDITLDAVENHVELGLRMRPEVNQAKLESEKDELEIVRTKNGLLPRMDLFITMGKSGYADSFGRAVSDVPGDSYDLAGGLQFQYPVKNRAAKARHRRSLLNREQSDEALKNLQQLVELDIRSAYIDVNRSKEQITASTATRRFQEEKLRIETEKFRVGRSTNYLVSQAQRDLLLSRINEVRAVANYLKALIDLYRLEGSLLERRGVAAPGGEPVASE